MKALVAGLLCFLTLFSECRAANFVGVDGDMLLAAERARRESAWYWTGGDLPGDWNRPCPITYRAANHSGGGATSFRIGPNTVYDWQMQVEGQRPLVIRNVIPHEVDHAVRASIVRKTIPRWLDEGCAMIWEDGEERSKFYPGARASAKWVSVSTLELMDYPADPVQSHQLYAFGLTAVETLLELGSPKTLIAFTKDNRRVVEKMPDYYGMSATEFMTCWKQHLEKCGPDGCYVPYPGSLPRAQLLPILEVWWSKGCDPCAAFDYQLRHNDDFRRKLLSRFHVRFRQWTVFTEFEATLRGIEKTPAFIAPGMPIVYGFQTTDDLLSRLGVVEPAPKVVQPPISQPQVVIPPQEKEPLVVPPDPQPPAATQPPAQQPRLPPAEAEPDYPPFIPPPPPPSPSRRDDPIELPPIPKAPGATDVVVTEPQTPSESSGVGIGERSRSVAGAVVSGAKTLAPIAMVVLTFLGGGGIVGGGALAGYAGWRYLVKGFRAASAIKAAATAVSNATHGKEATAVCNTAAPFPRQLDEVRQLLKLRQTTEGRVAPLDAIRGMFVDDEIERMLASEKLSDEGKSSLRVLRSCVNARVDEVAPIKVTQ